jgi:RNA polymerase sigma-70 factor (ECF subfamily)
VIADNQTMSHLAALAQGGDRLAYSALLTEARSWLLRYYRRRVMPCQIEDLVQDTLLSVHVKLASYDPARPFMPWLAAIARFRFVDHLRLVYRASAAELSDDLAAESDEAAITARISLERLFDALPPAQQRAIELVRIEGRSISEASASTGQSESLIKVNVHRGLKRLSSLIEST